MTEIEELKLGIKTLIDERNSFITYLNGFNYPMPIPFTIGPLATFKHILDYFRKTHEADLENITRLCCESKRRKEMLKKLVGEHSQKEFDEIKKIVENWA